MTTSPIGGPVDRVDGRLKVTGKAAYTVDNFPARLACGYLVTSTIARGVVSSMDTTAAAAAPGVLAVYTPFNPLKLFRYAQNQNDETGPPLQDTAVHYHGQVIGLVVAETWEQARDAAALVTTVYGPEPPAASFRARLVHAVEDPEEPTVETLAPGVRSIDAALAASDVTISATYSTPVEHHIAMEPHATVAYWTGDQVTVHTASQGVVLVVARLASTLGIEAAKIRVLSPFVGGGFGNKWGNWAHTPLAAAAARELGRPVKIVLTREQTFTIVGHRPATISAVELGARADGTLVAVKHDGTSTKAVISNFSEGPGGIANVTYAAESILVTKQVVTLDIPPTTIMRAPSEASGSFALECAMDELAVALKMDPLELRLKNYATVHPVSKLPWSSKHLDECYRVGAEKFGWSRRNPVPGSVVDGDWLVGLGMGTASFNAGRGTASIKARLLADGTATVAGTGADLGTGQSTVFAILAADKLGIPVDRVRPVLGDSATPTAANAGGSGSTAANGAAVQLAADAVKTALIQVAVQTEGSPFHGLDPSLVTYSEGALTAKDVTVTFGALLTALNLPAVEATATSPGNANRNYAFRSFGAHFCEIRVNRWTAEPRVSRFLTVIDAGTVVNAKAARSQISGAVVMAIGQALLEENRVEASGRLAGSNMASYLVPVNADIPPIDVEFLNHPDTLLSALGARGIGELGTVGAAGAIGNAVYNATGKRVRDLPITLDKLL